MAIRIPIIQSRERAQAQVPDARATASQFGAGIGQELASLGATLSGIGARRQQEFEKQEKFDTLVKEQQFLQGLGEREAEAQQNAPANGTGYTEGYMRQVGPETEKFLATVPPRLQPQFRARMAARTAQTAKRSATFERGQRNTFETAEINNRTASFLPSIQADPDSHDARMVEFQEMLDASGLSPVAKHSAALDFGRRAYEAQRQGLIEAGRHDDARALAEQHTARQQESVGGIGAAKQAIASIESGGNYQALGPVTKNGDRAYGKYQIMGTNVGPWTERWLGTRLTPQEFRKNPEAQERVFEGQFGEYMRRFGPEKAAAAWFAGPGGVNKVGARDMLGTSVAAYMQGFSSAYRKAGGDTDVGAQGAPARRRTAEAIETESLIAANSFKVQQAEDKAATAERKALGDDYQKEIYSRSDPNRAQNEPALTREYVEEARPYLSPSEYKGSLALLATTEETARDDSEAIVDLTVQMDTADPDAFIKDATSYVQQGKLKPSTFRSMVAQNRAARRDDAPLSPYKSGREFVRTTLEPGLFQDRTANAIARAAQARALAEYDDWAQANPESKRDAAMTEAQGIAERYQAVPFGEIRLSLGRSKYFADKATQDVIIEDVDAADAALLQDMDAGRLTSAQAAAEIRRLSDWRKTIEAETRRKEQNRGRTRAKP